MFSSAPLPWLRTTTVYTSSSPTFTGSTRSTISSTSAGKVKIISTVPSLDTPVCDTETRRFNTEAGKLGNDIVVLTVSVDLPMAMKRWCGAAGVDKVHCLSDYLTHDFGTAWGVRIHEIGLLARAIFVVDKNDKVTYVQLVKEVADEPDYTAALAAAKAAV
ncbi:MAG: thiol peroxidase [Rhodospirillales bacterium]|nr:thiol peroxidase [Rhodospirillales bacterium]